MTTFDVAVVVSEVLRLREHITFVT
jgi:hypothetical protein